MCVIDLDPCEVWSEKRVRARKQHTCSCCRGPIHIGETYVRHFSIFEGYVTTERSCLACDAVAMDFQEEHGMRGTPSSMPPLLDECIEAEEDEGHDEMADRWRKARTEMVHRRQPGTKEASDGAE